MLILKDFVSFDNLSKERILLGLVSF